MLSLKPGDSSGVSPCSKKCCSSLSKKSNFLVDKISGPIFHYSKCAPHCSIVGSNVSPLFSLCEMDFAFFFEKKF